MNFQELQEACQALTPEDKAKLAKSLLTGIDNRKTMLAIWSEAWTDWVEKNVSDCETEEESPRTLNDEIHDIVSQEAILDREQVQILLSEWFKDLPYLVRTNYDNLDHLASVDPMGRVLMHPLVAVWNGVVGIENAIARGVWKDFDEFSEMDERLGP